MEEIYKNLSLENLEGEEWRDIEGYNGKYQVSSLGRVKSLRDKYGNYREKILKQGKNNKTGYLQVILCKEGNVKLYRVNRLVATAFIPNPSKFPCVNHKNEIKTDNCVSNLEWCTYSYNSNYGNCSKKIAEKQSKQVYQYSLDGELIKIWKSTQECARQGFGQGNISACCNGERKSHKGFKWSYTEL